MDTASVAEPPRQIIVYPTEDHDALFQSLDLNRSDYILEVGGGSNPFKYANVVVDIDIHSGHHRNGKNIPIHTTKNLVQGDLQNLPFLNKCFDMVLCIQVLEHIENPAKACKELMRVAKKGFIEVPRKWTEHYAGYPTHQWLIDEKRGGLVFEPVTCEGFPFLNFSLPPLWDSQTLRQTALHSYRNIPCVQLYWTDNFKYTIREDDIAYVKAQAKNASFLAKRHYSFAKNLLYWLSPPENGFYHAQRAVDLFPENADYQYLFFSYLIMTGKWKEAWRMRPSLIVFFKGLISLLASKSYHSLRRIMRKNLLFLYSDPK